MSVATDRTRVEVATNEFDVASALEDLSRSVDSDANGWRTHIFDAIARWRLPSERVADEEYVYIIGGEAFNWRRLAERLAWHIALQLPEDVDDEMQDWLEDDDMFGGLGEPGFRRVLGHDKWRGYLNYFYGVTLERCLFVHAGNAIAKDRRGRGRSVDDDTLDEAFFALYEAEESDLWAEFAEEIGIGDHSGSARSMAQDDEFTYWLFKRRIGSTYQIHVAHEVRHGLRMFDRLSHVEKRRERLLNVGDSRDLLEFRMSSRSLNRRRPVTRSKLSVAGSKPLAG